MEVLFQGNVATKMRFLPPAPSQGYGIPLGGADHKHFSFQPKVCIIEAEFQASMAERSRAFFLPQDPTHRANTLPQVWQTENIGALTAFIPVHSWVRVSTPRKVKWEDQRLLPPPTLCSINRYHLETSMALSLPSVLEPQLRICQGKDTGYKTELWSSPQKNWPYMK